MPYESRSHIARIDRGDLEGLAEVAGEEARGRFLRVLLRDRGIDPHHLFRVEYYPDRQCWLLTQIVASGAEEARPPSLGDTALYRQIRAELRRAALSKPFPRHATKYRLPPEPEEISLRKLVELLGPSDSEVDCVQFTSEGGWRQQEGPGPRQRQ